MYTDSTNEKKGTVVWTYKSKFCLTLSTRRQLYHNIQLTRKNDSMISNPPTKRRKQRDDGDDDDDFLRIASPISSPVLPARRPSSPVKQISCTQSTPPIAHGSNCCPICTESWTSNGPHRVTCLKCGHLFGKSCIERWLTTAKWCPQCHNKAKKSDLRDLYSTYIMTLDPKEKAEFQRQQLAQAEEINRLKRQIESLKHQNERLKAWIRNLEGCSQSISLSPSVGANADDTSKLHTVPGQRHSRFSSYQRIGVPPVSLTPTLTSHVDIGDSCRVLEYLPKKQWILASCSLSTQHGVVKFSADSLAHREFVPLHSSCVTDMKLCPTNEDFLLSVSKDKTLRLTNIDSKNVIAECKDVESTPWSCAWDISNPNLFYCGVAGGGIQMYDIRKLTRHFLKINGQHSEPIYSMYSIKPHRDSNGAYIPGGLLTGSTGGISYWEFTNRFTYHRLSDAPAAQGKCISLYCDPSTQFCLASFRDKPTYSRGVSHTVFELRAASSAAHEEDSVGMLTVEEFKTLYTDSPGRNRSRAIVSTLSSNTIGVVASDEKKGQIVIFDASSGVKAAVIDCSFNAPLDFLLQKEGNNPIALIALNSKGIQYYRLL